MSKATFLKKLRRGRGRSTPCFEKKLPMALKIWFIIMVDIML